MLTEFQFLGQDVAKRIVVENPNKVADLCEEVIPVKDDLYTPKIPGSEQEITDLSYNRARANCMAILYQKLSKKRLEKELNSINGNGFSVIYLISQKTGA